MRTPKELMTHLYGMVVREIPEGTLRGSIKELDEATIVQGLKTHADIVKFMKDSFDAGTRAVNSITETNLTSTVKTPWNFEAPGSAMLEIIQDEYFHHRGQLYAYARTFGKTPPMMWDFEHNAPGFQPKQHAGA